MLWAMLFYYLFSGSSGGLVYDISKPVKEYVKDEATAKQIIAINKEMIEVEVSFKKVSKKSSEQLNAINENRLSTASEFEQAFAALDAQRTAAREQILERRFRMRALMSAKEWQSVYAAAAEKSK